MKAFFLCLILASVCNAQEHTAKILEVLPGDQFIVEISGKSYKAFNPEKVQEFADQKDELQVCTANQTRFQYLIKIADQNVTIITLQKDREHASFVSAMQLLDKERELRAKALEFAPVTGTPKGFGGWLLRAVNSPYGALGFKLVMPAAQFVKVMRQ